MQRRWKRLRAAAQAQEAGAEKDDTGTGEGGIGMALPRPSRLDKDEEYERAHSAVYNRESVVWDAETATVVGARNQDARAKNRKNKKTHSYVGSRVGLMGEWVEPESDEEDGPGVRASAGFGSSAASGSDVRQSWATVKPRETSELAILERAGRTMSLAGVGAGGTVQFFGGSIDMGRPTSMPADIAQAAESPGGIRDVASAQGLSGGLYHRPTYSRDSSTDGIGSPLLKGSRSPLAQPTFASEDLVMPTSLHADSRRSIDQLAHETPRNDVLARARRSVDVGLGAETDGATPRPTVDIPRFGGDATPVNRGSMDIASPSSHWDRRPR